MRATAAAVAVAGCTVHWCLQTAMQQYGVGRRCSGVVLGGSGDGGAMVNDGEDAKSDE